METFNSVIEIGQKLLGAIAAGTVVIGGITFFQGFQNQDGTAKHNGFNTVIAGAGIALLATVLGGIAL